VNFKYIYQSQFKENIIIIIFLIVIIIIIIITYCCGAPLSQRRLPRVPGVGHEGRFFGQLLGLCEPPPGGGARLKLGRFFVHFRRSRARHFPRRWFVSNFFFPGKQNQTTRRGECMSIDDDQRRSPWNTKRPSSGPSSPCTFKKACTRTTRGTEPSTPGSRSSCSFKTRRSPKSTGWGRAGGSTSWSTRR
jgi:hypothetical protein